MSETHPTSDGAESTTDSGRIVPIIRKRDASYIYKFTLVDRVFVTFYMGVITLVLLKVIGEHDPEGGAALSENTALGISAGEILAVSPVVFLLMPLILQLGIWGARAVFAGVKGEKITLYGDGHE